MAAFGLPQASFFILLLQKQEKISLAPRKAHFFDAMQRTFPQAPFVVIQDQLTRRCAKKPLQRNRFLGPGPADIPADLFTESKATFPKQNHGREW